jgi:hypothetical protein
LEEEIGDSDKEGLLIFMFIKVGVSRSSMVIATACIKGSNLSKEASGESLHSNSYEEILKPLVSLDSCQYKNTKHLLKNNKK